MYTQMGGWCLTTSGAKVAVYTVCSRSRGIVRSLHNKLKYYDRLCSITKTETL